MAILISDKAGFRTKIVTTKENVITILKASVYQEDTMIRNVLSSKEQSIKMHEKKIDMAEKCCR